MKGLSLFFFKQKTAYEILSGLVGSEMCIRDRFIYHFIYTTDTGDEAAVERWKADLLKYTKLSPEDVDARVRDACRVLLVRVRDACRVLPVRVRDACRVLPVRVRDIAYLSVIM